MPSIMRRFSSRSSSGRRGQQQPSYSPTSYNGPHNVISNPGPGGVTALPPASAASGPSARDQALGGAYTVLPKGGTANEGRPISSQTDSSFDFANRPVTSGTTTTSGGGGGGGGVTVSPRIRPTSLSTAGGSLSRTDQIVLQHFLESKYEENARRDLHYLIFPFFPQYPASKDLLPFCEIYHLLKTSPGASIISLGSANGVYIGFELATGSQLHIDLDDDWFSGPDSTSITHHRVSFRPYHAMAADPNSATLFKNWPKPLTIEFLEDQYQGWTRDLMSICWEGREIRELGNPGSSSGPHAATTASGPNVGGIVGGHPGDSAGSIGGRNSGSVVDDGYASDRSTGHGI